MLRDVEPRLPFIVTTLLRKYAPSTDEIRALPEVVFLTVDVDFDEGSDELDLLQAVNRMLWERAGEPPQPIAITSPLPLPIDHHERLAMIRDLTPHLVSREIQELTYALSYLITLLDLELSPVEDTLLDELRRDLRIDLGRAAELAAMTNALVTPGVRMFAHP
jgi:hypothetical protein